MTDIIARMRHDYRREVTAPMTLRPTTAENEPESVNKWTEWASAYYLGYEQVMALRTAMDTGELRFEGNRLWFRNVPVIRTTEEDHYAVTWGDRP